MRWVPSTSSSVHRRASCGKSESTLRLGNELPPEKKVRGLPRTRRARPTAATPPCFLAHRSIPTCSVHLRAGLLQMRRGGTHGLRFAHFGRASLFLLVGPPRAIQSVYRQVLSGSMVQDGHDTACVRSCAALDPTFDLEVALLHLSRMALFSLARTPSQRRNQPRWCSNGEHGPRAGDVQHIQPLSGSHGKRLRAHDSLLPVARQSRVLPSISRPRGPHNASERVQGIRPHAYMVVE
jgi:hypothetical protein